MIPAKELRIGNWMELHGLPGNYQQVDQVHSGIRNGIYSYYSPVPLTMDILLGCGFEGNSSRVDKVVFGNVRLAFGLLDDKIANCQLVLNSSLIVIKNILNVHQLQNVYFTLSGTDLDIQLTNTYGKK